MKTIFIDFWGTLVETGIWSPLKQVKQTLGIRLPFSEYVGKIEAVMMTQQHQDLTSTFQAVIKEFNIQCSHQVVEELVGMWNKSWMLAQPYDEVVATLQRLDHQLVLIANTDAFSVPRVVDKFGLAPCFDVIAYSFERGALKHDLLPKLIVELKCDPKDCILVGDSLHSDMHAAENAGIKGILVDRKDTRHYPTKVARFADVESML